MQVQLTSIEVVIRQLVCQQDSEVETLLSKTSLATDDELCTVMKAKSSSVMASIEECFKRPGHLIFQKNFLVIAKSFNDELGRYLTDCFRQKSSVQTQMSSLQQINSEITSLIKTAIKQLQTGNVKTV